MAALAVHGGGVGDHPEVDAGVICLRGVPGKGFTTAMKVLDRGRIHIACVSLGISDRLIDTSLAAEALAPLSPPNMTARKMSASKRPARNISPARRWAGSPTGRCKFMAAPATWPPTKWSAFVVTSACCGYTKALRKFSK
jgi:hypothetical protein